MDRTEQIVEKPQFDGGTSASLSANVWKSMEQSNAAQGKGDTGSLPRKASLPDAVKYQSEKNSPETDKELVAPNKADLTVDGHKRVSKDNAKNMIPERNAAPNKIAAEQGARVEKQSDSLVIPPLYPVPKS